MTRRITPTTTVMGFFMAESTNFIGKKWMGSGLQIRDLESWFQVEAPCSPRSQSGDLRFAPPRVVNDELDQGSLRSELRVEDTQSPQVEPLRGMRSLFHFQRFCNPGASPGYEVSALSLKLPDYLYRLARPKPFVASGYHLHTGF